MYTAVHGSLSLGPSPFNLRGEVETVALYGLDFIVIILPLRQHLLILPYVYNTLNAYFKSCLPKTLV